MEAYLKPIDKDGENVLEVECGQNKAFLYVSKLCQGSKGACVLFHEEWLTPNEFQYVSGRQTAKDWKRSIRHHGKSIKLLLAKGLVSVHPPICDCTGCKQPSPKNKNRSSNKRRAPLSTITQPSGDSVQGSSQSEADKTSDRKSDNTKQEEPAKTVAEEANKETPSAPLQDEKKSKETLSASLQDEKKSKSSAKKKKVPTATLR